MYISRVLIRNFRNFKNPETDPFPRHAVVGGENGVGEVEPAPCPALLFSRHHRLIPAPQPCMARGQVHAATGQHCNRGTPSRQELSPAVYVLESDSATIDSARDCAEETVREFAQEPDQWHWDGSAETLSSGPQLRRHADAC